MTLTVTSLQYVLQISPPTPNPIWDLAMSMSHLNRIHTEDIIVPARLFFLSGIIDLLMTQPLFHTQPAFTPPPPTAQPVPGVIMKISLSLYIELCAMFIR